jgi:hypothetical protein
MAPVMIVTTAKTLSFLTISLLKNSSLSGTTTVADEECVDVDPSDMLSCERNDPSDAEK